MRRIGYEDPAGLQVKKTEDFRKAGIIGEATFPSTLQALEASAFSDDVTMNLTIPPTLLRMSSAAFPSCCIHTLTIQARGIQVQRRRTALSGTAFHRRKELQADDDRTPERPAVRARRSGYLDEGSFPRGGYPGNGFPLTLLPGAAG